MSQENLILASDRLRQQRDHTRVPNEILYHDELSPQAKTLWSIIFSYCHDKDTSWPGMDELSDRMNRHQNSLREYRQELIDADLLEIERRGQGQSNLYRVYAPDLQHSVDQDLHYSVDQDLHYSVDEEVQVEEGQRKNGNNGEAKDIPGPKPNQFEEYWNDQMPESRKIHQMTRKRKKKLRKRREEDYFVDNWKTIIDKASRSSFLTEEWERFDVNWVLKNDSNYTKILEGKYEDGTSQEDEAKKLWEQAD